MRNTIKKYGTCLILLLAALCVGGLLWLDISRTVLLDGDGGASEADGSASVEIEEGRLPMADSPEGGGADDSAQSSTDPFSCFSEEQRKMMDEVLELVNAAREEAGLSPLELNPALCGAAMVRAEECTSSLSHTRPDGSSYKTALADAGITSCYTGENAASGHTDAQQVVDSWLKSEGHRANILNERFTQLGVGFMKNSGGRYRGYAWVQLFVQ